MRYVNILLNYLLTDGRTGVRTEGQKGLPNTVRCITRTRAVKM